MDGRTTSLLERGREGRRWIRRIRNGLELASAWQIVRHRYPPVIAVKGRPLRGDDPHLLTYLVEAIFAGEYDYPGFAARPGDQVLDIGANVGVFSVLAATRGARVHAVEPHPDTFAVLSMNAVEFGFSCTRAAVVGAGTKDATVTLLDAEKSTAHAVAPGVLASEGNGIEVPATSLAQLVGKRCDLLKLDAEGSEFPILLNSGPEPLERIDRMIVEVHHHAGDLRDLARHLYGHGFLLEFPYIGERWSVLLGRRRTPTNA